jgi:predicted CopG family antitoxin
MTQIVPRKTIYLPDSIEELVREHAAEGESFSATIVRLVEIGAREDEHHVPLEYIGAGEGPGDLGINAEKYLGLKPWGPGEGPGDEGPD